MNFIDQDNKQHRVCRKSESANRVRSMMLLLSSLNYGICLLVFIFDICLVILSLFVYVAQFYPLHLVKEDIDYQKQF